MHDKKLILLLSAMTPKELKQCRNYLATQLNYTTEEFRLFDYIWKSKNKWDSKRLEIERAHRAIKPTTTRKKFESLMSALVVRIEKFIIYHIEDSIKKQYEDQFRLANFYKSRGLDKFFRQSQRKLLDLINQMPPIDTDLPYFQLQQMHQAHFSNLEDLPENMLEKMMASLTLFYQQKQLVYEIEFKNQKQPDKETTVLNTVKNINMKGVAEQSSVFANKIFTAISPINSLIYIDKIRIGYIELILQTSLL